MEIINVYKESMPGVKLAARRYTNEDRDETGTFAGTGNRHSAKAGSTP